MISDMKFQKHPTLSQETVEAKKFVQDHFLIDYSNTSRIYSQNLPKTYDVKINNYLCYQEGQTLYKITEILYDDKIIRIQDKLEVTADPAAFLSHSTTPQEKNSVKRQNNSKNLEKIRIFYNKAVKPAKQQKKDKKNIVKNMVKMFLAFLEKKSQSQDLCKNALDELVKLMKKQKFNNRLIKNIVDNCQINKIFLKFLQDHAEQQIKYSRIQDKKSHYEAIKIYKNLLGDKSGRQCALSSQNNMSPSQSSARQVNSNQNICKNQDNASRSEQNSSNSLSHEAGVKISESQSLNAKKNKIFLIQNGNESLLK